MIDYFSLLDQPHAPWLDLGELKKSYYHKTLQAHPDTKASRSPTDKTPTAFASLNEAYQVLQDPKRRVHHLLTLEGAAPSSNQSIPQHLQDLFPLVGALTQRANLLLKEIETRSNRLGRSLLKPQILEMQNEVREVRTTIQNLFDGSLAELCRLNPEWKKNPAEQINALSNLYVTFAYLTRWGDQLDEIIFQLSLH